MKSYLTLFLLCVSFLFTSCATNEPAQQASITKLSILPKPSNVSLYDGSFKLGNEIKLYSENSSLEDLFTLNRFVDENNLTVNSTNESSANFKLLKDETLVDEGYSLTINDEGVAIHSKTQFGANYGLQSFFQLFRQAKTNKVELPYLTINDAPEFPYRGMHLDVGRHFFEVDFIKEYLDHLAMLKMNTFHWHLTEDQGWRIEIKKYPRLTTHAAYRNSTIIGHNNEPPEEYDGKRYGGFYTQEEIKEVVAYATKLGITVIPEIEMPGHAQAAVHAYPELGCTSEQVDVAERWGVFDQIFCPNEKTFAFLEDVLTEVIALFPGEYIHIGGDEAPKKNWENSAFCQNLIQKEGLGDEAGLQSYFIKRIETFLNSKGKQIIGWDEILEGGLAPNATVMSWRGVEGGIEAAKSGHNVIMTPTSHCYFDYYQSENEDEPLAIGGFLPLKKVYSYHPIPEELTAEEAKSVIGAQGNVWTEYMKTTGQVEYMVFPRIFAMSEVLWSGPSQDVDNDYIDFTERIEAFEPYLDELNVNYSSHK